MIQASAGGGGPVTYNVDAYVNSFLSPGNTGDYGVTGTPFQAKLLSFLGAVNTSTNSTSGSVIYLSNSFSTVNEDVNTSIFSSNNVLTTQTSKSHDNINSISNINVSSTLVEGSVTSVNPTGFIANYTKVNSTRCYSYFSLGGDVEVKITEHQMNATNSGQSFAHQLSGKPDLVIFAGVNSTVSPPEISSNLRMIVGAANDTNQCGASIYSANGQTTSICRRVYSDNRVIMYIDSAGIQRSMAVSSIDSTNVNVTYPTTADSNQWRFFMISIKGCRSQIGNFDTNGLTTPYVIPCTGIVPKLLITYSVAQGVDSKNTVLTNGLLSIGFSDGTNTRSMGVFESSAETTMVAYRYQSSSGLVEYNANSTSATKRFEAGVSFSGENVVITPVLNNSVYGQGGYIIIGE